MRKSEVIVVGAGIAGLTSAAILSKQGLSVTLIESHTQQEDVQVLLKERIIFLMLEQLRLRV